MAKQAKYTVYIVDDDDAVRDSLVELFEIEGFEPRGYASCEDFLDHFHPAGNACLLLCLLYTSDAADDYFWV